jgi:hypothetical protein
MYLRAFALAAASLVSSVAQAADKPLFGPVPAWVRPVAPPAELKADEAPVRILLVDQQHLLEPGRQVLYSAFAFRIQTPQGLSAGNLSFPWRPESDEFTVHKLIIRRNGQAIDVLASGQTFTVVRREVDLESAMLDGVLTANIQPEGLQVGDVVEFAASLTSSDPVMKGHVEQIAATWTGLRSDVRICASYGRTQSRSAPPDRRPASGEGEESGRTHVAELTLDGSFRSSRRKAPRAATSSGEWSSLPTSRPGPISGR